MIGVKFTEYTGPAQTLFERLLEIFKELLLHTSGDVDEAWKWLEELDKAYDLTNPDYTLEDFWNDLMQEGYVQGPPPEAGEGDPDGEGSGGPGSGQMSSKMERAIRERALEQIFGKLKRGSTGDHPTPHSGAGDDPASDYRQYQFGDSLEQIAMNESIKNAYANHGIGGDFSMTQDDLVVQENQHKTQMSTVLMIDISHSMILYGEDRITPAKRVALALAEFIKSRYPKDTLDILVYGNEAWPISLQDLPYLQVGPYHTNTVAGLDLAMDLLRKKKNANKQIFMITDGKPSCITEPDGSFYKNPMGLDEYILRKCYSRAAACRKAGVPITTFMIARDPYLQQFVQHFTEANQGKAFFTGLKGLGDFIFQDYERNRRRRMR
jgi:uncharacterized protein with von Willebrand factor type A (vWA) domain